MAAAGGAAPYLGMMMAECAQAGLIILSKQALSSGMSSLVFVTYSNALAALVLLPISLILHRRTQLPPLNLWLLGGFFLLGLLGSLAQIFSYIGINYSSATLGTAMLNLVPGFTFLLAAIFRMEKLDWRSLTCLAKSAGTIVSVAGAFVVSLYQGPPLLNVSKTNYHYLNLITSNSNWLLGGLFLTAGCVMVSSWFIVQGLILQRYPAELIIVFFYCFFVAIQCGIVTLIVEKDPSAWSLKPTIRLFVLLYSAVFGSAFQVSVVSWCLRRKGPVFVSMFKPLGIVIAVAVGVIFFNDTFYLGRLIGILTIVVGFYSVMWGKAKEEKMSISIKSRGLHSTIESAPLLENKVAET